MNKVPAVLFAITAGMILCQALALRAGDYGEKYESYPVDADYPHASPAALEAWRDQKFGLRIHWGVYAVLGLQESWPLTGHRVNGDLGKFQEQYNQLYQRFNPTEFNADQWCEFMRRCGFTFFVFTARHHDGFSMFDTRTKIKKRFICTGPRRRQIEDCDYHYSIMDTPFRRDVTKELAEAAHRRGLGVGLYYSHTDWHDADFRLDRWHPFRDPKYSPQTDPEGWQRFIARHREQVRELLTGYGKIERFEWDLCFPESAWLETVKTVKMARKLQPDVLMRDRGIGNYGDIMTPEMWIPKANPDDERAEGFGQVVNRPWQVIIHMGNQFSYDPKAENYKSFDWALTNLIDIVSKGGNFMVGIGPDGTGRFHPVAVQRLERVGRWLAVNGEAIYRTRPHRSWHDGESIRYTRSKDNRFVYAIGLKWPGRELKLQRVRARDGTSIRMLGFEQALAWRQDQGGLTIEFPESLQDPRGRPSELAYSLKIERAELKQASAAAAAAVVAAVPGFWCPTVSSEEIMKSTDR